MRSGGVWSQQQKLEASDAEDGDGFGLSVTISGDTVVISAAIDDGAAGADQGSAYVFVRSGAVWSQQQKLEASDAGAGDYFGNSVAISGETVVVGAFLMMARRALRSRLGLCLCPARQSTAQLRRRFPQRGYDLATQPRYGQCHHPGRNRPRRRPGHHQHRSDQTGRAHRRYRRWSHLPGRRGHRDFHRPGTRRAQRSGNGRVYTIYFTASDGNGGSCQGSVTVCVTKSGNGSCTNGGAIYDSTQCDTSLK